MKISKLYIGALETVRKASLWRVGKQAFLDCFTASGSKFYFLFYFMFILQCHVPNCLQRADMCVVIIASWVSCYMYHVVIIASWVSCYMYHVVIIASWVSCYMYHVVIIASWVSCYMYHVVIIASWVSCDMYHHVVIIASWVSCDMYHVHVYTGTVSYCSHYTNQIPEMLYLTMDLAKGYINHTYDKQQN